MEFVELANEDKCPSGALFQKTCSLCDEPSKYRCPKCSALTCSLKCVKKHKEESDCDGMRDKVAFVHKDEFQDRHLLSDYHFLEDMGRTIDNAKRAKRDHGLLFNLPINLYRLRKEAWHRNTNLLILPPMFTRRKQSTTFLRYSDKKIFWRLEWNFPQCDVVCSDDRVDEETLLCKCLDKYLLPELTEEEPDERLAFYHSMGHKEVTVLLKNENSRSDDTKYIKLRQNKTLKANFNGRKIIEYPTLLVVPNIHLSCYIESKTLKNEPVNPVEAL